MFSCLSDGARWFRLILLLLLVVAHATLGNEATPESNSKITRFTKLTGYGSRDQRKSILQNPPARKAGTKLWMERNDGGIDFKIDDDNCTLSFSIDEASWNLKRFESINVTDSGDGSRWVPIEGIYGIYEVPSGVIWVLITSSSSVLTSEPWGEIRKVESMEMIYLPSTSLTQRQASEQNRQLRLLRQALKSHEFYFVVGDKLDMTQSLQRAMANDSPEVPGQWWGGSTPDSRFFWNEPAVQPLMNRLNSEYAALVRHVIPVTSAFVGIQRNITISDELTYDEVLISRRNRFRAGTRFTKRGADVTGAVANYAETEQICLIANHTILSHVQTRGSIPLRWSSPADVKTYRPRVRIGTDPLAQARALQNHLLSELSHYVLCLPEDNTSVPKLSFVNLVDKKKDQGRLGRAFDAVLQAVLDAHANQTSTIVTPKSVEHVWFDFHSEVKHGRWDRLNKLLKKLAPVLDGHKFFKAIKDNQGEWTVEQLQNGVIRTNCMDCLDRTNVVQSIFGRFALFNELYSMSNSDSKRLLPDTMSIAFRKNALTLPWTSGEVAHRLLWADNADAISRLYAGTPALKGDFTRTGKRTKKGALDDGVNSLQRYYLNNFMDADRQEGMDLMTGYASFSILREGEEPHEDAAAKFSKLNHPDMSLLEAARALMSDLTDAGDSVDENSFIRLKENNRKGWLHNVGGPILDLRWLSGDLQEHVKALAVTSNGEALQAMDERSASGVPWWVIPDSASDGEMEQDEDDHEHNRDILSSVNIGHLIGGVIASVQAPLTTAMAVTYTLGWSSVNDKGK